MRGLPGAILILLLAGIVIGYLAMEKFAPRTVCNCEEECREVVSPPTHIPESDDPPLPPNEPAPGNATLDGDVVIIEQEMFHNEVFGGDAAEALF